jgi:subtilisin family serine protease
LANNADINAQSGWTEYLSDSTGGNRNGPKVVVAVIDSGVDYNHPDLRNMMWVNPRETPGNGIDDDNNGIIDDVYGADFTNGNTGDPMDRNGHGTHCAGVIAAERDNSVGIAGVASVAEGKVKIMAVKGLGDDGTGSTSGLLKSLNYAIGQGAKISSNSWGSSFSMSNEVERLWGNVLRNNQDHLFVAAAGNDNDEISNNHKPMPCGLNQPNLLCVGNSNKNDRKSGTSNYGKDFVHVFAPGTEIYSTYPNNGYRTLSGTSMACPHASGLAALIMTMRSNLKGRDVKDLIEAKVQRKTIYKSRVSSGGLIDVENTLKSLNSKDKAFTKVYKMYCSRSINHGNGGSPVSSVQEAKRLCAEHDNCIAIQGISDRTGRLECDYRYYNRLGCELCSKIGKSDAKHYENIFILQKG